MTKRIAILYSGGLDSSLMARVAKHQNRDAEIISVFFDHGHDSAQAEMSRLPPEVKVHKIDWLSDQIQTKAKASMPLNGAIYIPGRNMVFVTLAASLYLANEVWLGAVREDNNEAATDKNEKFRSKSADLISYVLKPFIPDGVKVVYPISDNNWTKIDLMDYCLSFGLITREEIGKTSSCWHNKTGKQCGVCSQCIKRALYTRNFDVPEVWENDPLSPDNKVAFDKIDLYRNFGYGTFEDRLNHALVDAFDAGTKLTNTRGITRDPI